MPLITLVSKKRCQSASVICSNGLGSKMTRISARPARRRNSVAPWVVARSAAIPSTAAPASVSTSCRTASLTAPSPRPLITTAAPASARPLAIANPIPAVEPLITARWPCKSIFILRARLQFRRRIANAVSDRAFRGYRLCAAGSAHRPAGGRRLTVEAKPASEGGYGHGLAIDPAGALHARTIDSAFALQAAGLGSAVICLEDADFAGPAADASRSAASRARRLSGSAVLGGVVPQGVCADRPGISGAPARVSQVSLAASL